MSQLADFLVFCLQELLWFYTILIRLCYRVVEPRVRRVFDKFELDTELLQRSMEPVKGQAGHPTSNLLSILHRDLEDIKQVDLRGLGFTLDDVPAYVDALTHQSTIGIDDRKFLLEKLLTLMARAPDGFTPTVALQQAVIGVLYKDLPHPPSSYLSLPPDVATSLSSPSSSTLPYAYRSANGSNYNPLFPTLGMAGMPYARSVPSSNFTPNRSLPDPALVFDTLLKREKFEPHPGGISSLFFAFADLIIHCIFSTDYQDVTKNTASSYLDLSVLYGSSESQVASMRRMDGTGAIWPDAFADPRLMMMPPSVGALLVIFNRNHNYIADKLLNINEKGTFVNPPPSDEVARRKQDDELFHRSRLVNSGFFMQVILADYVGAILGLVRDGLTWRLNPLETMRQFDHEISPQGEGNAVSVEFNLMYRWHAATSQLDEKWTEDTFKGLFPGKDFSTITVDDFRDVALKTLRPTGPPKTWTFGGLERDSEGRLNDDKLASILLDATQHPASAFKARGTPEVLRVIEILGMEQARQWGVCTMNEFRKFMGLKQYSSFKEWNPDPAIYTAAESLYHHIDNLELHVGMQAEQAKVPMSGAGLCPGYTISRAILGDAVCLTRGDRFMTVDFTPFNFTSWGYQDCQVNKNNGSYGGMLTKLLFRHLPAYYPTDSAYAFFPFMVPKIMKEYVRKLPDSPVNKYSWERPTRPQKVAVMDSRDGEKLTDTGRFGSEYRKRIENICGPVGVGRVLFTEQELERFCIYLNTLTKNLIKEKSIAHVGSLVKYVDIVKDVINVVPVYWIANEILGLPLKSADNPRGIYGEQELFHEFADVGSYVFSNFDPGCDWELREKATKTMRSLTGIVKANIERVTHGNFLHNGLKDALIHSVDDQSDHSTAFLKNSLSSSRNLTPQQLAASLTIEVVSTAATYSKALSQVVDFCLDQRNRETYDAMIQLSNPTTSTANPETIMMRHVREALRLSIPVTCLPLNSNGVVDGQMIFASLANPDPYVHEFYGLTNSKIFEKTASQVLRAIFSLPDIRRAAGPSGHLNSFNQNLYGMQEHLYIDTSGKVTPWPASMLIQYTT